jgi:hypothetical protein
MRVLVVEEDRSAGWSWAQMTTWPNRPGRISSRFAPYRGAGSVAVVSTRDRLVVNA